MPDAKAIKRLKARQNNANAELKARIKKAQVRVAKKIQGLQPENYPIWNKKAREQFLGTIGSHYELLGKELDAWGKDLTGKVALDAHKSTIIDIKNMSGSNKVKANTLRFSRNRVNRYWEIVHPDNAQHLAATFTNKMTTQNIQALRTAFVNTYRQRTLESWTQAQFHKELYSEWERIAGNLGSSKFVDAAGRSWSNDRYISMLTRTITSRVSRDSYLDTLVQDGDDLARIGPSGDSCPICRRWIGVIISISGKNPNFPSYQDALNHGMFHPNCDCLISRIDETVHADDIARQEGTANAKDWNSPEDVEKYKTKFMNKKPLTDDDKMSLATKKKPIVPPAGASNKRIPKKRPSKKAAAATKATKQAKADKLDLSKPAKTKAESKAKIQSSQEQLDAARRKNAELEVTLQTKKRQIANMKTKLAAEQAKIKKIEDLKTEIAKTEAKTDKIRKRLIKEDRKFK